MALEVAVGGVHEADNGGTISLVDESGWKVMV